MRRLRPTDGTPAHRKAIVYHLAACKRGNNPLHATLRAEATPLLVALKTLSRAGEDAEDDAVEASAGSDATEIALENVLRDVDAVAQKLDREDPSLAAQKTIYPDGFGAEIDPEGGAQLANLPALRKRIAKFDAQQPIADALVRFDAAKVDFEGALQAEDAAYAKVDTLFQDEHDARRAIREQIESAHGLLRSLYKARPALAEQFFLKDSGSRRAPKPVPQPLAPPKPA